MTKLDDQLYAFMKAVHDPDPSSTAVATDIALEMGRKLWWLGEVMEEERVQRPKVTRHLREDQIKPYRSNGAFEIDADTGTHWTLRYRWTEGVGNSLNATDFYDASVMVTIDGHNTTILIPADSPFEKVRDAAAQKAWAILDKIKNGEARFADPDPYNSNKRLVIDGAQVEVPSELVGNPVDDATAKKQLWGLIRDTSKSSTEVAQDLMLERGWLLADVGEWFVKDHPDVNEYAVISDWVQELRSTRAYAQVKSYGGFWLNRNTGIMWLVNDEANYAVSDSESLAVRVFEIYTDKKENAFETGFRLVAPMEGSKRHQRRGAGYVDRRGWESVEAARSEAALEAWRTLIMFKDGLRQDASAYAVEDEWNMPPKDSIPVELTALSTVKKNPDDLAAARDKYKEFHRYDSKREGEFPAGFEIPKQMVCAGKAKWVTYRSSKVDPATLRKPSKPVDYIHEHDAGVKTYLAMSEVDDDDLVGIFEIAAMAKVSRQAVANWRARSKDFPTPVAELQSGPVFRREQVRRWLKKRKHPMATVISMINLKGGGDGDEDVVTVPEKFRDVGALTKLGECLGFCVRSSDGEDVEAEATAPLPELYCTPDGKCLFVIQSKKKVIAMSWGGALGVFARGIDG